MELREQLNRLMLIQSIKDDIAQCEKDKAELTKDVKSQNATVKKLQAKYSAVHQKRIENQKKADSLEVKIQSKKEENEKLRVQLNTTKNQSDYDKIRKSIMSNEADMEIWEDGEIQALEDVDELKIKEADLKAAIASEKVKLDDIKAEVAQAQQKYDGKIAELEVKKDKTCKQIDASLLAKYEQIANSKNDGLAKVTDRICRGCFTQVPKQIENELMRWDKPVFCHSCGRLLMLDENF